MRCFVAVPMPEGCQRGLAELVRDLGTQVQARVSWTRPGNWHLTLKFLGEMPEARAMQAAEALAGVPCEPFVMQAGGGGFFPNPRSPRVLWVGLRQGGEACRGLAARVDEALAPLGFEPEKRPFRGHLTLGRIRQGGRIRQDGRAVPGGDDWSAVLERVNRAAWEPFEVRGFALYKSDLTPQGPRYSELAWIGAPRPAGTD